MQWKPNENVSEAAGHQDSPVETMLVQIIMCHHVLKPTLKAILCIPYCSAEQCMKVSDWSVAHADCTLQPHTAPAVRLPPCANSPSLYRIQTLSQSITGGKSFTLPLCAPNNDGGQISEFHTTLHICLQATEMSEGLKQYGCECSASASSSIYPSTTSF